MPSRIAATVVALTWTNHVDGCIPRSATQSFKFTHALGTFFTDTSGSLRDRRVQKIDKTMT
jgi:hypothetical protein